MNDPLLKIDQLAKSYGPLEVLHGIDLVLKRGEILGLLGASGCGKSTLARCIMGFVPYSGTIERPMLPLKTDIQMIFQNPQASLNPRMTVGENLGEFLRLKGLSRAKDLREKSVFYLNKVNLNDFYIKKYPHQLSGGECQRVAIARALCVNPQLLVADEPLSALDVSVRREVLQVLLELKNQEHLSILFISHDLALVKWICDRFCVMDQGQIVEELRPKDYPWKNIHPQTQKLIDSVVNL